MPRIRNITITVLLFVLAIGLLENILYTRTSICAPCPLQEARRSCSQTQRTSPKHGNIVPMIYFITPTYRRPEQIAEITRLANTLRWVPKLHWILAEDANELNPRVIEYLNYVGVNYTYLLNHQKPKGKKDSKGAAGRVAAVTWIKTNNIVEGVVYFGDDDNTYDLRLFDEIRSTKNVAMWPVGLVTGFGLSTPIVKGGRVIGFYDGWIVNRKFPVDMAGFAVGVPLLLKGKLDQVYTVGYSETKYLESLNISKEQIEVKADNCTKIYVWHTKTKKNPNATKIDFEKWNGTGTNLEVLANILY